MIPWGLINLAIAYKMFDSDDKEDCPCSNCKHYRGLEKPCAEHHYDAGSKSYCSDQDKW